MASPGSPDKRPDPWWSLVGLTERLSGLPGRFSFPVVQAAQGAMLGVIGLYWDAWRHAGGEGPKVFNLIELGINAVLVRVFAPGRAVRRGKDATAAPAARLMLIAGTIGLLAFGLQVELNSLLDADSLVDDLPHLIVIGCALAASVGVLMLLRDATSLARPRPIARPWTAIAIASLLVGWPLPSAGVLRLLAASPRYRWPRWPPTPQPAWPRRFSRPART